MKIPGFKIMIPLPEIAKKLFGGSDPVPIERTPDNPEYAEANQKLRDMNREIREQDDLDVKMLRDLLKKG